VTEAALRISPISMGVSVFPMAPADEIGYKSNQATRWLTGRARSAGLQAERVDCRVQWVSFDKWMADGLRLSLVSVLPGILRPWQTP
jgi:hypothetical protein